MEKTIPHNNCGLTIIGYLLVLLYLLDTENHDLVLLVLFLETALQLDRR
jgi:hypothetical protein